MDCRNTFSLPFQLVFLMCIMSIGLLEDASDAILPAAESRSSAAAAEPVAEPSAAAEPTAEPSVQPTTKQGKQYVCDTPNSEGRFLVHHPAKRCDPPHVPCTPVVSLTGDRLDPVCTTVSRDRSKNINTKYCCVLEGTQSKDQVDGSSWDTDTEGNFSQVYSDKPAPWDLPGQMLVKLLKVIPEVKSTNREKQNPSSNKQVAQPTSRMKLPGPLPLAHFVSVHVPMPNPYSNHDVSHPIVTPLIFGNIKVESDRARLPATVVMVNDGEDGSCDILVDTGLAQDKNTIIGGLASHGKRPEDIEYLVLTHSDPTSMGNLNLFLNAQIFYGNKRIFRDVFFQTSNPNFTPSRNLPSIQLCRNSYLFLTAGRSPIDLTLVVQNVQHFGTIGITGPLFTSEMDYQIPSLWTQFSWNQDLQRVSRDAVVCMADYIAPGHGRTFAVTVEMKRMAKCMN